jgi:hypothetical protein
VRENGSPPLCCAPAARTPRHSPTPHPQARSTLQALILLRDHGARPGLRPAGEARAPAPGPRPPPPAVARPASPGSRLGLSLKENAPGHRPRHPVARLDGRGVGVQQLIKLGVQVLGRAGKVGGGRGERERVSARAGRRPHKSGAAEGVGVCRGPCGRGPVLHAPSSLWNAPWDTPAVGAAAANGPSRAHAGPLSKQRT